MILRIVIYIFVTEIEHHQELNSKKEMKKKILGGAVVVAIGLVGILNMDFGYRKQERLSAVHLDNIEALADGESSSKKYDCYSILNGSGQSISCSTCNMAKGKPPWYHFGSKCTN